MATISLYDRRDVVWKRSLETEGQLGSSQQTDGQEGHQYDTI